MDTTNFQLCRVLRWACAALAPGLFLLLPGCSSHPQTVPEHVNVASSGPLAVSIVPESPKSLDKVRVNILDTGTSISAKPDKVDVSLNMPSMDMGDDVVHAISDGQGKYHADVQFTMPGQWHVKVTAQSPTAVFDYTANVNVR